MGSDLPSYDEVAARQQARLQAQQPAGSPAVDTIGSTADNIGANPALTPPASSPTYGDATEVDREYDLANIVFTPVSPGLRKARRITNLLVFLSIAVVLGIVVSMAVAFSWHSWVYWVSGIALAITVAVTVWVHWLIGRQVPAIGYAITEHDLLIRRGIMFRKLEVVPFGRIQMVEVTQGPLLRAQGISTVSLMTAALESETNLPGIPTEQAEDLRIILTRRGKEQRVAI